MKTYKNIFLLSIILSLVIGGWLIPKTMGEKKTQYVRIYTEERDVIEEDSSKNKKSNKENDILKDNNNQKQVDKKDVSTPAPTKSVRKKERVVIQKDTISGNFKRKYLKPSLFSRSMHFVPEPLELADSAEVKPQQVKIDSTLHF